MIEIGYIGSCAAGRICRVGFSEVEIEGDAPARVRTHGWKAFDPNYSISPRDHVPAVGDWWIDFHDGKYAIMSAVAFSKWALLG